MWTCLRSTDVRGRGPGATESHLGLRIWQLHGSLWPQAHSPCCCQRMRVFVRVSHMCVFLSMSISITIPHNLVGKQQPIKITAICMHKPRPIYPGSLVKVQGFIMQCVWARLWVSIMHGVWGMESNKATTTSHCTQPPENFNLKPLISYSGSRINSAPHSISEKGRIYTFI